MNKTSEKYPIRFKFMPTPSAKLHIGHAWLVFVMHSLVKAIRRAGHDAELILVLDEINMTREGSFNDEATKQYGEQIICDMQRLGTEPDRVVYNGDRQYLERTNDSKINKIVLESWNSDCIRPASYFLHNALLDASLEITHIIRGEDRREFTELYEECYRKIGYQIPVLSYIPLLLRETGETKISASVPYLVSTLLEKTTLDELFCFLAENCIAQSESGARRAKPICDRETAERLLLGDGWWAMLADNKDAEHSFFSRFIAKPRVTIEDGRCVVQS